MAHDVFVSYASEDKPVADAVCGTLEANGIRCWIAPRDVLPGVPYGEAIIDAILEARIMVLIFSSKANRSGHIPKEIERAVSKGLTVMPLRIEDVAPAKSLDYFIGNVHWLDALTPPLEVHLKKLTANVQTLLLRSAQTPEVRPRPPIEPPPVPAAEATKHAGAAASRPAWTYAVIGGLAAAVLTLGAMFWMKSQSRPSTPQSAVNAPPSQPAAPPEAPPAPPKKEPVPASQPASPAQATPGQAKSAQPTPAPPATAAAPAPARMPTLTFAPGSSIKLEQLIGDQDKELHRPTLDQTSARYGFDGAQLGYSFEHQGHAYFLFGDVVGRFEQWPDTMATTNAADPEQGVRLDFLTVGDRCLTIDPAGVTMGPFELPVAGISLGGQMYVVVSTSHTAKPTDRSVLTKFILPSTFQPLRTISQLPAGHFIRMSMHLEARPLAGLPPGGPFVVIWGTGDYRKSDVYLSLVPVAQFESGRGTRYFAGLNKAGAPQWSEIESEVKPVVENGTIGDLSVTWCKDLGLWLMTYDSRPPAEIGILFSYSRTPWGPWSKPQVIFNAGRDGAYGKFLHNPNLPRDDGLAGPVFNAKASHDPRTVIGGVVAPFVVERWTKVRGSELNLYYTLSVWNPYVVVLMKSRLQVE